MAELKLQIGVEVKEAEDALKSFVTNINKTTASVQKFSSDLSNFGRAPLHSIDNISKAFLELKRDISNVKFSEIPPVTADIRPAQIALKTLSENAKETSLAVEGISDSAGLINKEINKAIAGIDEVPPIDIDVSPAQQALRTLVAGVDRTADQVEALSADIKDSLRVSAIPTIDANIDPAKDKLQTLANEVKSTTASVQGISERFQKFSNDVNKSLGILSTNSLENFKRKFFDLKQDLSNVTFSALPPVTLDISPAKQQLQKFQVNVDSAITAVKADLTDIKITALPPPKVDVRPAEQSLDHLADEARLTGEEIAGIATTIQNFSQNVNRALGSLPFHNIEAFRQAFLLFKQDLSKITIASVPPLKIDVSSAQQSLQKLESEAEKTETEVGNVSAAFQRFSQSIARSFGSLPLSSIAAFREAFLNFKTDLANVKISTIPPVKVDVSQAEGSLQHLTATANASATSVNSLAASYQRWGGLAATANAEAANSLKQVGQGIIELQNTSEKGFDSVTGNVNQTVAAFQRFTSQLNTSVGALSLKSVEDLRQGVLRLKADLSAVKITAIPPIEANVQPALQAINTLTAASEKSGVAITNVSSAYAKWAQKVAQSSGEATNAVKEVDLTVETLRAKIAARKDLIVTEKDISKIEKLNKEIESLESILHQVQNAGKTGFFNGAPLDKFTDRTNKAGAALGKLPRAAGAANGALLNLTRIAQDAPFGFIAIQNNISELIPAFQRLRAESKTTGAAFKAFFGAFTGLGGIGFAISAITSVFTFMSLRSREAKDDTQEFNSAIDAGKEKQQQFAQALEKASGFIVQQAKDLQDLRTILLSTAQASVELTEATVKQGLARFIFDEKNVELQKIISAEIGKQIILRKRLVGVAGLREFTEDPELRRLQNLEKAMTRVGSTNQDFLAGLRQDISALKGFNETIGQSGGAINTLNALGGDLTEFFRKFLDEPKKGKKEVDDFIQRAKQLADELEKIGFVAPARFSFFDSFEEQLEKAKKVFNDFNNGDLKLQPRIINFPTFSEPQIKEEVKKALNVVEEGMRTGVIGLPKIPIGVQVDFSEVTNFSQNTDLIREFKDRFKNLSSLLPQVDLELAAGLNRAVFVDALRKYFKISGNVAEQEVLRFADQFEESIKALNDTINGAVAGLAIGGLTNIGEAIGNALAGADVGNAFRAFATLVADAVSAIGKQFITLGATALLAKKALASLFTQPALAITAGIALVAVAQALRSALNKGVQGFAAGGLVFGPTVGLIGEGVGTSRSNPEVIAPLDKLKSMLGEHGVQPQVVVVRGKLRGSDMILQNARTTRSQNRLR